MESLFAPPEPRPLSLYPWQEEAVEALRENIRRGVKNQILAAPTGSGKTIMSTYLVKECYDKGKRAVFVCDRIPLINQTSEVFDTYGIPHGVIQADHWRYQPWQRIQVASAQTLQRRGWPEDLALIVVDEAHTVMQTVAKRIARRDVVTIGLTATPFTKGLGKLYDRVVTVRTLNQLTEDGYLAPFRVYAASEPDMSGAKVVAGEWTEREAEQRSLPIIGDIVQEYLRHGRGKKFICFGVTVAHCEEIQRQMMAAGVMCGLYTYQTSDDERAEMIRELAKPDSYLQGLVSVAALSKGFDNPTIEVVILARPLRKSLAEHIQMLGRGLRRDPDNPDKVCTVLDHSGNMLRFWGPMWEFFEEGAKELDDGKPKEKKPRERTDPEPCKCPKCAHVHRPLPACPSCGHEYPRRSQVVHLPGELSELTGLPAGTRDDRQAVYSGLLHIAAEKGYTDGWAAYRYRERFGAWPNGLLREPATPTPELRRWYRAQMIRWAKSRAA